MTILRRTLYYQQKVNKINAGYACDELSGVLFKNGKFVEAVSLNDINDSYYINLKNGTVHSEKLKSRILKKKDALPITAYTSIDVNKAVKDFSEIYDQTSPLNAFVSIKYIFANGQDTKYKHVASYYLKDQLSDASDIKENENQRNRFLSTGINRVLVYKDSVAGVINKVSYDYFGYGFSIRKMENG